MKKYVVFCMACVLFLSLSSAAMAVDVELGVTEVVESEVDAQENVVEEVIEDDAVPKNDLEWGFRGVKWGTKKSSMDDDELEFYNCVEVNALLENCGVKGAVMNIYSIPLVLIRYKFLDDKFVGVTLKYDKKHGDDMRALLDRYLGPSTDVEDGVPQWRNDKIKAWASNTHFAISSLSVVNEVSGVEEDGEGTKKEEGTF